MTSAERISGRAPLWRHRDFALLWSGQTVSEAGSAITQYALPLVAVLAPISASTFAVGLLRAATNAAFLLIALPAGVAADRMSKRRIMIWSDVVRLIVIGSIPLLYLFGALRLWQLFVVAMAAGICSVLFDVSYQSYVPSLLVREQLSDGNGKLAASEKLAKLAGPTLGSGLVAALGPAGAMTADALSYAASVVSLLCIGAREHRADPVGEHRLEPEATSRSTRPRLREEVGAGIKFVAGHVVLRKIVACTGFSNLFTSMGSALMIIFVVRVLHVPTAGVGPLLATGAVGGVVGGMLAGVLTRRIGSARIIWVSALVFGAIPILIIFAAPGWHIVFFAVGNVGIGVSSVVYNMAQLSYRQAICPPEILGRMNAAVRWMVWGTLPLGAVLGGVFGSVIGIRATLCISIIGSWLAGLFVFFSPLREMRDVPSVGSVEN